MGFIEDEFEIMDLEEGFLNYLFKYLKKECATELKASWKRITRYC